MAYDEALASRIRSLLDGRKGLSEKKMFGGIAFFLHGNMCCGVLRDDLVLKVKLADEAEVMARAGARPFDFTGKPMRGILTVAGAVLRDEDALAEWIEPGIAAALAKPPKAAKASKPAKRGK